MKTTILATLMVLLAAPALAGESPDEAPRIKMFQLMEGPAPWAEGASAGGKARTLGTFLFIPKDIERPAEIRGSGYSVDSYRQLFGDRKAN